MKLLEGVRVIDLGRYVAGPYCATLLGYLGAEVIRIEKRGGSEDRFISPLFRTEDGRDGEGGLFMQTCCNKKSMTLNLSSEAGRALLEELIGTADVVVANMPPKALARLGLEEASFRERHPRTILAVQTGFGLKGPARDKGGFDGVGQALSGAMVLSGTPGAPMKAAAPYVDFSTAIVSAFGVLAALMAREKTGRGQQVEAALQGTALAVLNAYLVEQAVAETGRVGTGNRVQTSAPSDVFATKDGHVLTHVVGDGLFARWAKLIGAPELIDDPRYQGDQARGDARDELCARMAEWCGARTTDEAVAALEAAGVPCGPVLSPQQALEHPQVAAMAFLKPVDYPGLPRPAPVADLPVRFSDLEAGIETPPAAAGAHTDEILRSLGRSEAQIAELRADGAV